VFCGKCGNKNPDENKFCAGCGAQMQVPANPTNEDVVSTRNELVEKVETLQAERKYPNWNLEKRRYSTEVKANY